MAGHDWPANFAVVVCDHVAAGSEVRTVHVDEDGLCFQCGSPNDDPKLACVLGLDCAVERPGLLDLPFIPIGWIAYREADRSWFVEQQREDD